MSNMVDNESFTSKMNYSGLLITSLSLHGNVLPIHQTTEERRQRGSEINLPYTLSEYRVDCHTITAWHRTSLSPTFCRSTNLLLSSDYWSEWCEFIHGCEVVTLIDFILIEIQIDSLWGPEECEQFHWNFTWYVQMKKLMRTVAMDMSIMVDRIIYTKIEPQWHIDWFVTWRCVVDSTPHTGQDWLEEWGTK